MQGSFFAPSHTALHVTQNETRCAVCDDTVAIGATCDVTCTSTEPKVSIGDNGCFTCPEGTFGGTNECVDCGGARRCVDTAAHLLCPDNELVVNSQCSPSTQQDSTLVVNNHVVKCTETHFADGAACGACPPSCVSCANSSSCAVCAAGTSLSSNGACSVLQHATAQTHNGSVACDETFLARDADCVQCSDVFGGCASCNSHECLSCDEGKVFNNGVCRAGNMCASSSGTVCTSCEVSAIRFNATDCIPAGDCTVYEDGTCVQCVKPLVLTTDGTCAGSEDCTVSNGGVCLRCTDGMYADEDGICRGLPRKETHQQSATRRASHVRSTQRSARHATRTPGCS